MGSDAPESRERHKGFRWRRSHADMLWGRQYVDGAIDTSLEGPRAINVVTGEYWEEADSPRLAIGRYCHSTSFRRTLVESASRRDPEGLLAFGFHEHIHEYTAEGTE